MQVVRHVLLKFLRVPSKWRRWTMPSLGSVVSGVTLSDMVAVVLECGL